VTTSVLIRPAEAHDVAALTAIYNHYVEHSHATFDVTPVTENARREWMSHYALTGRHRLLVADADGTVVGCATSSRFRDRAAYDTSVEVGIYLAPERTGRGIGQQLYTALFAALEGTGAHRAYAGIALPNEPSMALHRRFGFTDVGTYTEVGWKFGRYWDVQWMEKPLE
jgi:phosphinothricin acetyltransferase